MFEDQVLALFEFDHIGLHALQGSDEWWNLNPILEAPHRAKSARDTSIVAKVKRLGASHVRAGVPKNIHTEVIDFRSGKRRFLKRKIGRRVDPWPPKGSRKIASRKNNTG